MAKKYVSLSKLSIFLDNLKNTFSSIAHSHKIEDISDLTIDSELSSTSTNPVQNKVLDAEFEAISDAMSALEEAVDGKASADHDHNDNYYTKTEMDSSLAQKSQVQIIKWEEND